MTVLQRFINRLTDEYAIHIVRPYLIKRGCEFISPYSNVITTRLHGLILSILLHKPVRYINNTTGKLSAYVDTWHLRDIKGVSSFAK